MRDLKFRAYDNHNKEWVYSNPTPDIGFWKWVAYDNTTIVSQWTGLKDNNGTDIYEGDILKPTDNSSQKEHRKVIYLDGGFCYSLSSYTSTRGQYAQLSRGRANLFKVIGNIYENKPL